MLCEQSERLTAAVEASEDIFLQFIESRKLSLREVETLARYVEIYQLLSGDKISNKYIYGYCYYRTLAIIIYTFNRELALNFLEDKVDAQSIMKLFGLSKFSYQTSEYNVDNYEYAIFGIVYKYLSENSSLLPAEEKYKKDNGQK